MSPGNLVGIVIGLRAGPNHVGGKSISFLQSVAYRPPVGTGQPPIQIVIVRYFSGGKEAGIWTRPLTEFKNEWGCAVWLHCLPTDSFAMCAGSELPKESVCLRF